MLDWSKVAGRSLKPQTDVEPAAPVAKGTKETTPVMRTFSNVKPSERHALFTRLPKDALLVIDLPDLAALRDAFKASAFSRLYTEPKAQAQVAQMLLAIANGFDQLRQQSPELTAAVELLPQLNGHVAMSVSGLTAETLATSPGDLPWVVTVIYDAGEQADHVAEIAAPLISALAIKRKATLVEKSEPAWGCEIIDGRFKLEFERIGNVFELRAGGRNCVIRELAAARKRTDDTSFFSTRVATEASSVESLGAKEVAEVHLQLLPMWDVISASGDGSDTRVLARTGLTRVFGASMAIGRTKQGLAEAFTLHSPEGVDLITHVLTGQPMQTSLARCVPADLANAGLYTFDGSRVMADLCLLLPSEAQSGLVRALTEFRREYGVDLEKDLLANIGPTIALATSGLPHFDQGEKSFPRFLIACQLVDQARAQHTLNAFAVASGQSGEVQSETINGVHVSSLLIPLDGLAQDLELHWCIRDSVLFASSGTELLREALLGMQRHDITHVGLRGALANAGAECFAAGFSAGDENSPDAITHIRRTSAGLELTSSDGAAMQSTIFTLFSLGVASSLAIPKLMHLRLEANEASAAATLVVINDAQIRARMQVALDEDGDGLGESLFLPELCGDSPLRGGSPPPAKPWVDFKFEWVAPGVGAMRGFRFCVDLPSAGGLGVRSLGALAENPVSVDGSEERCAAYAWPMDQSTGSSVFVFDSQGGLYRSDNRGAQQHYVGDRAPEMGAHWTADGRPGKTTRYIGRDGGVWLRLRGLDDPDSPGR